VTDPDPEYRIRPTADRGEEAVLRAKYLDYCSAQLADLLLYLSPDEIFLLAEKAQRSEGPAGPGSYMHMMQTATTWLSTRVSLPTFEEWLEDYRANPERYERYLLGLWESDVEDPAAR
jgi:hypothetical protein